VCRNLAVNLCFYDPNDDNANAQCNTFPLLPPTLERPPLGWRRVIVAITPYAIQLATKEEEESAEDDVKLSNFFIIFINDLS
jgi:hypothetical protein